MTSPWFWSCREGLVLLDMQSVPAGQEGWLAFDVTSASNHWLLHPRSNLGIRLYVEVEDGEGAAGPDRASKGVPCAHRHSSPCRAPAVCRLDRVGGSQRPSVQAALHGDLLQREPDPVSPAASRQAQSQEEETQIRPSGPHHPRWGPKRLFKKKIFWAQALLVLRNFSSLQVVVLWVKVSRAKNTSSTSASVIWAGR